MLSKKEANKIDKVLKDSFGVKLSDCRFFIGFEYVKLFFGTYVVYYNRTHKFLHQLYNIDIHLKTNRC